jgi:hypothetical protein
VPERRSQAASRSLLYSVSHREYSKPRAVGRGWTSNFAVRWPSQDLGSARNSGGEGSMCYELTIHVEPQHRSACVSSGAREQCGLEMTHTFQSLEFLEAEAPN